MTFPRIVFVFNETITRFHDVRIVITLVLLTDRLSFRVQWNYYAVQNVRVASVIYERTCTYTLFDKPRFRELAPNKLTKNYSCPPKHGDRFVILVWKNFLQFLRISRSNGRSIIFEQIVQVNFCQNGCQSLLIIHLLMAPCIFKFQIFNNLFSYPSSFYIYTSLIGFID